MFELMTQTTENERERHLPEWKYSYVAGCFEFGSNLTVSIKKSDGWTLGYIIQPRIYISNKHRGTLSFIGEFCREHDMDVKIRSTDTSYRIEIMKRDDIKTFLNLISPYLIGRHEPVKLITDELIPMLEKGDTENKEQFLKIVKIADEIRELTSSRGKAKYDTKYFKSEWNL